jgi:predicted 3-demethylubiquinone-9 3-methyltransferase (glyoxalase superfamily)
MENNSKNNLAVSETMLADKWIGYISDKYGVSKQRVILLMSALPKDPDAIEAVLKRERFVR